MNKDRIVKENGTIAMKFASRFVEEMNKVKTYKITDMDTEHDITTIDCQLVCDIITILLDEFGLNDVKEIR